MLKAHFSRFFAAQPGRLHFAAHSHHPWPDVSFEAHQQCWLDAVRWVDDKWDHVFGEVLPRAQRFLADELKLPDPGTLTFAPNTHEFVVRLLSCLPERARVVTTDSEFHSFERQTRRLEEDGVLDVIRVHTEPFATFPQRFAETCQRDAPDLIFFSHVFFNSGAVVEDLEALVGALPRGPLVVIDGYHGFCAVPTDLSRLADRAFYLAGGYKYAMAGEGACFLHVPRTCELRPRNTGWFAAFGALEERAEGRVPFARGGARFLGATFDPAGLYRLNSVMAWRRDVGLTTALARAHAHALQRRFVELTHARPLVVPIDKPERGHFLTVRTPEARAWSARLKASGVGTDARDDRLRFGFGVYQDEDDVARLAELAKGLFSVPWA